MKKMKTYITKVKRRKQEDFFTNLPSELIIEILSRLPFQTIIRCKCVCKSWNDLFETREFTKSHLSKSAPALALTTFCTGSDKKIELTNVGDLHFSSITKLNFTYDTFIQGSADGLLLLKTVKPNNTELYLCNPVTREYTNLHSRFPIFDLKYPRVVIYGFGVSKITGEYKAIRIINDLKLTKSDCEVYTVGTGSWRSIATHALHYRPTSTKVTFTNGGNKAVFVNGNLHWLVYDLNDTPLISCFDLETELFSTFSLPPIQNEKYSIDTVLVAVEGTLCFCDASSNCGTVIWLMKEYGIENTWTREYVIRFGRVLVVPIRVFRDGVILMASRDKYLFYYSSKDTSTHKIYNSESRYLTSISYTPSVLPLRCLGMENVLSLDI